MGKVNKTATHTHLKWKSTEFPQRTSSPQSTTWSHHYVKTQRRWQKIEFRNDTLLPQRVLTLSPWPTSTSPMNPDLTLVREKCSQSYSIIWKGSTLKVKNLGTDVIRTWSKDNPSLTFTDRAPEFDQFLLLAGAAHDFPTVLYLFFVATSYALECLEMSQNFRHCLKEKEVSHDVWDFE